MSNEDDVYMWQLVALGTALIFGFCVAGEAMLTAWGM